MKSAVSLCALAAGLAGCAFGNRTAKLTYPPEEAGAPPAATATVVLLAPEDKRPEPRKVVGIVRNGLYMHTADVETQDDVAAWVREALKRELVRAGIAVVEDPAAAARLATVVTEVHSEAYMTYSGKVSLDLAIERQGGPPVRETIVGESGGSVNWASTGDSHADVLAEAVRDAARKAAALVRKTLAQDTPKV